MNRSIQAALARGLRIIAVAVVLALPTVAFVLPAAAGDIEACLVKDSDAPTAVIEACSRAIAAAGALKPGDTGAAKLYAARGKANLLAAHQLPAEAFTDYYDRLRSAIKDLTVAISLDRTQAEYFLARALAYYNNNTEGAEQLLGKSIQDVSESIRLNPLQPLAFGLRARLSFEREERDKVVADVDMALALEPAADVQSLTDGMRAELHHMKGLVMMDKAKHGSAPAAVEFEAAVRLNPSFTQAHHQAAQNAEKLGSFWPNFRKIAIDEYTAVIDRGVDPRSIASVTDSYGGRGRMHRMSGRLDAAVADFTEMVRLDPENAEPYVLRGQALEDRGDYALARGDYGRALERKPGEERATAGLARLSSISVASAPAVALIRALPAQTLARERRVALVIGNGAYPGPAALKNATRDAVAVAAALKHLGFQTVELRENASRANMLEALSRFAAAARQADWALVYFAGHGVEVERASYLLPVDAQLKSARDILVEGVRLDQVLGSLDGARTLRLAILDACRDNPIAARAASMAVPVGQGLGAVRPGSSTVVFYGAKSGQAALDGNQGNSPFVMALVRRMGTPGLELGTLFRQVADDVARATGGRQEPAVFGTLPAADLSFRLN